METIKRMMNRDIIESDSKIAIQAIKGEINPLSDISSIVEEIRVLASVLMNIQFLYCNRKANDLTDELVKKVDRCTINLIWII